MTTNFEKQISDFIIEEVSRSIQRRVSFTFEQTLERIVNYYETEKGVKSTVEELKKALDESAKPMSDKETPTSNNNETVPPSSSVTRTRARSRSSASKSPKPLDEKPAPGEGCVYQFRRGGVEKKGKYCGKPCKPGINYCNHCSKLASVKKILQGDGQEGSSSKPSSTKKAPQKKETKTEEKVLTLDVKPLGIPDYKVPNYFFHVESGLVIKRGTSDYYCVARKDDDQFKCLSNNDKLVAKKYTLTVCDEKGKEQEMLKELIDIVDQAKKESGIKPEPKSNSKPKDIPKIPKIQEVPGI
jgi:hypothetical protein